VQQALKELLELMVPTAQPVHKVQLVPPGFRD
jgi:ATP-dependent Zn protease